MIGLVYYADDPHKRVFRIVYPENDDAELDQPPTDGKRQIMRKGDGTAHSWTSFAVDAARPVAMDKVAPDQARFRKKGANNTPASEPVVYLVNLGNLTSAQLDTALAFIAYGSTWATIINLGNGDPATLIGGVELVSPCWIVVVDGTSPSGTLLRQRTASGHTVGVWVV